MNMNPAHKILIIDDEPLNIKILESKLASEGYYIIRAYNGYEALKKADNDLPDLILLDIMMPGLDGYEITEQLKNNPRTSHIPIILITALNGTDDKLKGLNAGADEFLNRPVDTAELKARVSSLLSLKQFKEQFQSHVQSEQNFLAGARERGSSRKKTIFIVEDNEKDMKLLLAYFQNSPYHIKTFSCGERVLDGAQQENVDLILLDVLLPDIHGFEVYQQLKDLLALQNTQFVLITCLEDTASRIKGIRLGVDDFFVKPVHKELLLTRIEALLKKKEHLDKLRANYAQALHAAITDKLTGLYNSSYFKQFLELEIARSTRQHHPLTLLLFDLDDFKEYNDTLGHLAGDQILREVGELVKSQVRKIDMAARYGGEEFAIILTYTDTEKAFTTAERLRQAIESYPFSYKNVLPSKILTVSIGLASFQSRIKVIDDLIECADKAMYQSKREGKNRIYVFQNLEDNSS